MATEETETCFDCGKPFEGEDAACYHTDCTSCCEPLCSSCVQQGEDDDDYCQSCMDNGYDLPQDER